MSKNSEVPNMQGKWRRDSYLHSEEHCSVYVVQVTQDSYIYSKAAQLKLFISRVCNVRIIYFERIKH